MYDFVSIVLQQMSNLSRPYLFHQNTFRVISSVKKIQIYYAAHCHVSRTCWHFSDKTVPGADVDQQKYVRLKPCETETHVVCMTKTSLSNVCHLTDRSNDDAERIWGMIQLDKENSVLKSEVSFMHNREGVI
ncbi:hypothetical protein BX666DRAFT_1881745 [Dichotomocladium elegans]|nr:hypothetical protein BX666DRAFT_1881745 [Dichotomocladium elegans]